MDPHRLGLISTRLHYFQLVARFGSIRQAAIAINVAPSSISRIIAQLEEDLGTQLFERVRQRLKLTSAGELMLYHARASERGLTRACTEINDLQGLRRGTVTVAVVESVARGLLPQVLAEFWQRYPAITVEVKVASSQQAFDAVNEGDCDIGIAFDVRAPRNAQRLAGVSLGVGALVRPDHALAGRSSLHLFDLSGERLVLSDLSLSLGASLEEAIHDAVVDFGRRVRTNSIGIMIDLAVRGLALALQTRVGAEREIADGILRFIPCDDPKLRPRKLLLVARSKAEISDAAASLATMLTQVIEAIKE
jgi:DNA-binding transcriptional LysR family regulator